MKSAASLAMPIQQDDALSRAVAECPGDITIERVSGAIGVEIQGIDLSRPLHAAHLELIRTALFEHCVVFFRNQSLTLEQHKEFTALFGSLYLHPNFVASGGDPHVIEIVRMPGDKKVVGEDWHSDTAFAARPPMGSVLYAVDIPPYGGDTTFSSQYAAYDALSDGMKRLFEGLRAVHSDCLTAGPRVGLNADRSTKVRDDSGWQETRSLHPVVRTHPVTRRKALYVNRMTTIALEDMTEAESKPLLEFLYAHAARPEFTCRFRWRAGSVAFWDNRCCQHLAINDTWNFPRRMRRFQIAGEAPV
jgi:taurine dioxygenase